MSVALASSPTRDAARHQPLRVMVVDDSVVIRGLIGRWIEAEPDMVVAASLRTGLDAVNQVERVNPDVAVLDIEMPDLDGIAALPQLLAKKRDLVIIMASTLTRRNAEISFKALSLGAADYIPKPETTRERGAAGSGGASALGPPCLQQPDAARPRDRFVDGGSTGADVAGHRAWPGDRP